MNEQKEEKQNKFYLIKKLQDKDNIDKIKEYFEDSNKFLQLNKKLNIGHLFINKKISSQSNTSFSFENRNQNLNIPSTPAFKKKKFNKNLKFVEKRSTSTLKTSSKKNNIIGGDNSGSNSVRNLNSFTLMNNNKKVVYPLLNSIHYTYKSPKEIIEIFEKFKTIKNNSKKYSQSKIKSDFIKNELNNQEKFMLKNSENFEEYKKLAKRVSKRCHRKENNLMFSNIENFHEKQELINFNSYYNQLFSEKCSKIYWLMSLRRANNIKKEYKLNYINDGCIQKENWKPVVDPGIDDFVFSNNPYYIKKPTKNLDNLMNRCVTPKNNIRIYNELKDIKVIGKKLYDQEYNNFVNSIDASNNNIKLKLYKDPKEENIKNINDILYKECSIETRPYSCSPISIRKKFGNTAIKRKRMKF